MAGKDPAKSKRLKAELWAPRINTTKASRDRVPVLVDAMRAHLPHDDPVWAELDRQISRYLKAAGFGS